MHIQNIIERYLGPEEEGLNKRTVLLLCVLGYLIGVLARSFYVYVAFTEAPYVILDGFPMINTEDGYYFAQFVKEAITKGDYSIFAKSNGHGSIVLITWLFYQLLPFLTIEQIAVCIPMIISPLVAVPFILLGRLLNNTYLGFFAGIMVSLSSSYFRRSSFAYYDSDLFSLTAPTLIVLAAVYVLLNPNLRSALLVAIALLFSAWADKGIVGTPIYLTFVAVFLIMHFRNPAFFKLLILLCVPLLSVKLLIYEHLAITIILYILLRLSQNYPIPLVNERTEKIIWATASILFLIYVIWNQPIFNSIRGYISGYGQGGRGVWSATGSSWSYYKVTSTIVEARTVNLQELVRFTADYFSFFIIGLLGACFALIRFPFLVVGGVLLGIGFFSLSGGVRFSMYLIPILAIGTAYVIMMVKKYIGLLGIYWQERMGNRSGAIKKYVGPFITKFLPWMVACSLFLVVLYPKALAAYNQYPRAVARVPQVEMLSNVNKISEPKDYIISWWDYGYVMKYYSDMQVLIDGGRHHNDNFIVSKAFASSSQALAANLLREGVESYATHRFPEAVNGIFGRRRADFQPNRLLYEMTQPNYVLMRPETRDIYLYIPYQMLRIYGVVRYFSDLNLVTGEIQRVPFINTQNYRVDRKNNRVFLPNNNVVDLNAGTISRGNDIIGKVNTFYHHRVRNNKSEIQSYRLNSLGGFSVIVSDYYRIVYVGGPEIINSNFIQMFFFKNYDENYFELIDENLFAVLYKLKRKPPTDLEQSRSEP